MTKAQELAVQEVTYRKDIVAIDHPDARGLEHSWSDVEALLDERDRLAAAVCNLMHCNRMQEHEHGHHAAECPLNIGYVPTWKRDEVPA